MDNGRLRHRSICKPSTGPVSVYVPDIWKHPCCPPCWRRPTLRGAESHTAVTFNGNEGLPIYSFIIHSSFAIVFAVFYCVMAEYYKSITLWQGAAFGLLVWVGAHLVLMPLTGTVPSPFPWVAGGQTWAEHFSEALGHVIWLWSIELVRRDVRNRITHQPDPWVPLDAEPAR